MIFSKSIAFNDEGLGHASAAAEGTGVLAAEQNFLDKLREGDADSFDLLITRYSGDLYALLYRLTENAEDAADLTQETFLSAVRSIKSFRGESELKTWLFRIAINHSRNRFRWWKRRRRDQTVSLDDTIGSSELAIHETLSSPAEDPESAALRLERERALSAALMDVKSIYREAVMLCDIEGSTYEEASHALDINIGTLKSRISRGRENSETNVKRFLKIE